MKYLISSLAAAFIIIVAAIFCHRQNNKIDITKHVVYGKNIVNGFKVVHLSDMHSKPFFKVVEKVKEIEPDVIMITGDYINDREKNKEKMLEIGRELLKTAPVFYITGNHERRLDDFNGLMNELKKIGFHVLLNDISEEIIKGNTITVLGLDENQANFKDYAARRNGTFKYKDMSPYFNELNKHSGFKIVLSHYPENFELVKENNYSQYDFDVQLSGHAHGGQFILPFAGPVFSPGQGLFPKYARGSFGTRPKLIVSRGLGNAEFPLRLFNHPEIIVLEIKRKQ